MICTKCGNEKTLLPELLLGKEIYTCSHCTSKMKEANNNLEQAKLESELASARLRAGISKRLIGKTFNDFLAPCADSKRALHKCIDYATKVKQKQLTGGLMLLGKCGTGKSLIASAMIEFIGPVDNICRIKTLSSIVLELKESWRNGSVYSESELINFYGSQVDLLIIDEIGRQRGSETESLLLFDILDRRYNEMLPVVLISNLDVNEFKAVIGEACVDRLRDNNGTTVAFGWGSARK